MTSEQERREASFNIRVACAEQARDAPYSYRVNDPIVGESLPQPVIHQDNGDEQIRLVPVSYTKGLPHDPITGLVANEDAYDLFVKGIDSGSQLDFKQTPLGPASSISNPRVLTQESDWLSRRAKGLLASRRAARPDSDIVRAWESAGAGLAFDTQGPDSHAVTMPPAPKLGSDELTAELAEVYLQAALRDLPFAHFDMNNGTFAAAVTALNQLPFFQNRQRIFVDNNSQGSAINQSNAFRGFCRGDTIGPYISQFMLIGNTGINGNDFEHGVEEGLITYGALTASQKVRTARAINYMTTFEEYIDVQNGADFRGLEEYIPANRGRARRFIATPRDLATYVHYDALYEAYLNACLILLGAGAAFDPGIPFQQPDFRDHQQGFALYGGPHILTLVTEVATRALKAVRYQKFDVHRRCRPEALAARMEKLAALQAVLDPDTFAKLMKMDADIDRAGVYGLLNAVASGCNNNKLLPMAFVEGSPMHPAYGAGHATVAGACTTLLKAWFDHTRFFDFQQVGKSWSVNFSSTPPRRQLAFQAQPNGKKLNTLALTQNLTVEGELNKVAANISVGRDWAGVHYYTDYSQSMLLGEEIAIKLLQEQSITYLDSDVLSFTVPKFDGSTVKIQNGQILPM